MTSATITELLRHRAAANPDAPQYQLVGRNGTSTLTLGAVAQTARRVAGSLRDHHTLGSRAILLAPDPGVFIAGFFGACEGGLVPVPVASPGRSRLDRGLAPLRSIAEDCKPAVIITSKPIRQRILASLDDDDPLSQLEWADVEDLATGSSASAGSRHPVGADDVAYLQYTSGSTATPKGVQVTHGAVMSNLATIHKAFESRPIDHAMIWLPTHHDMGLLGGILAPLYSEAQVSLATPQQFLQSPHRWLRWISDTGATVSGGPDSAYRLCVERIRDDQLEGVDLSRWRLAFTGAEPIRAATLDSFAERFAPFGFDRRALYPCYGLAEATLMVTGTNALDPPRTASVSRSGLHRSKVAEPASREDTRTVVSCGTTISAGETVIIVDPNTTSPVAEGTVGEIWYAGSSAARGYHGQAELSARTFGATLSEFPGVRWLRTGDTGFLRDGELYVTGRIRETIVLWGRNLDAADIDHTVQEAVTAPRLGLIAALNPVIGEEERLVIAIEAGRAAVEEQPRLVAQAQADLAARFGVRADDIVLVSPGTLPRTTSGKLKRAEATQAFERGEFDVLLPDTVARNKR